MLLRSLFALTLFAAIAETMLHGVHALAQSVLRRQALLAVHDELAASTTAARDAIARAIEAGGDPRAPNPIPPATSAVCRLRVGRGCALKGTATIAFAVQATGTPSPCPDGRCTISEQPNDSVAEGRVDAVVAAQATSTTGAVLAARSQRLTFRTLREAPYAALAGQADETVPSDGTAAGDDAGAAPKGAAPGTLIDVLYENAATGATMPANVWQAQVEVSPANRAAWSP
ncbi:MAG: hypothetical protein WB615_04165 [Candidatus Tumulicola sp.]